MWVVVWRPGSFLWNASRGNCYTETIIALKVAYEDSNYAVMNAIIQEVQGAHNHHQGYFSTQSLYV